MYSDWGEAARRHIAAAVADLPADATLKDRQRALRAAGQDFHGGTSWGRKVWPRECRKYLEQHGLPPISPATASPASKQAKKLASADITFPFRAQGD